MKKLVLGLFFVLLLGVLLVSGCVSSSGKTNSNSHPSLKTNSDNNNSVNEPPASQGQEAYKNKTYGFSLISPEGWSTKENFSYNGVTSIVVFFVPNATDFAANINVKAETLQSPHLSVYFSDTKQAISNYYAGNDFVILKEGDKNIGGINAKFIDYAYNYVQNDKQYPLEIRQVLLIRDKTGYIITYATLQKDFEKYLEAFDTSVNSLVFE